MHSPKFFVTIIICSCMHDISAKDFYKLLGVNKTASTKEIERAYRKIAPKYHPDLSRKHGEPSTDQNMVELNEAREVLCDPVRRRQYDQQQDSVLLQNMFASSPEFDSDHPIYHSPIVKEFEFGINEMFKEHDSSFAKQKQAFAKNGKGKAFVVEGENTRDDLMRQFQGNINQKNNLDKGRLEKAKKFLQETPLFGDEGCRTVMVQTSKGMKAKRVCS